ncbi:MAG: hypothetical protein ACI3XQ_06655 [Eubacteriales bacterium]
MKKIISFILMLTMLASCVVFTAAAGADTAPTVWDGTSSTTWYEAKGEDGKYHISTAADLAGFASLVTGGTDFQGETVCLDADIYLNDITDYNSWTKETSGLNSWPVIGNGTNYFQGSFDGQGKTIYGMYINSDSTTQKGLFSIIGGAHTNDVSVKNLNLKQVYICPAVDTADSYKIGALVGQIYTNDGGSSGDGNTITVENIYVCGIIKPVHLTSTKNLNAAGICGYMNLSNTKTDTTKASNAIFRNCVVDVDVSCELGEGMTAIKYVAAGIISNDTNNATTVGMNNTVLENCINIGDMGTADTGASSASGIIGFSSKATSVTIRNCANFGNIYAHGTGVSGSGDSAGGAIAYKNGGTLTVEGFYHEGEIKDGVKYERDGIVLGNDKTATFNKTDIYVKSGVSATYTQDATAVDTAKLDMFENAYTDVKGLTTYVNADAKVVKLLTACGASVKEIGMSAIQMSTDNTAIRFISKLDSLEYSEIGFEIKATEQGNVIKRDSTTAYKSISAHSEHAGLAEYSAEDFGAEYLCVDGVNNLPTTGTVTLYVRFYTLSLDGETTAYPDGDGKWYKITIKDGAYQGYEKVEIS